MFRKKKNQCTKHSAAESSWVSLNGPETDQLGSLTDRSELLLGQFFNYILRCQNKINLSSQRFNVLIITLCDVSSCPDIETSQCSFPMTSHFTCMPELITTHMIGANGL